MTKKTKNTNLISSSKNTHQVSFLLQQAVTSHQNGELKKAKLIYEQILGIQPNHFDALQLLGTIEYAHQNYAVAIRILKQAITLKSDYAPAHYNLGNSLKGLELFDEALASYDRAIDLIPNYVEALTNRGVVLHDICRFEEAIASYERAIIFGPDYAKARMNKAVTLLSLKKYDEALATYDEIISRNLGSAETFAYRGNTHLELRQLDDAVADYDNAIRLKPDWAEPYASRGDALRLNSRYIDGLTSTQAALKLNPKLSSALQIHSSISSYLSDYRQVCEYSDQALSLASQIELASIWENRLYLYIYHPDLTARQIVDEHIKWGSQFAALSQGNFAGHDRTPKRRLKIGYVSPDFRGHTCRTITPSLSSLPTPMYSLKMSIPSV
jgi:tetratricopeptide (TPR) repeat protein